MELKPGMKHAVSVTVNKNNMASRMKSGSLPVFATPAMLALMGQAAAELCASCLPQGSTTVGIHLDVSHLAASVEGAKITAEAEVTAVEGRKTCFAVRAFDDAGPIGAGTHERFTVYADRFVEKAKERFNNK